MVPENKPSNNSTVVVGLGRSGIAAAKLLKEEGKKVLIIEKSQNDAHQRISKDLETLGISVELGKPLEMKTFDPLLPKLSKIITSPSVPWDHARENCG